MVPTAAFGSTGHNSSRILFGGASLSKRNQEDSDRTMELLLEKGVNHLDTAADYGDSELRLGPWMKTHRDAFFLATKTQGRSYEAAKESLYRSLDRLQTDHVDLFQMHILVDEQEWQTAFGPAGAMEFFRDAQSEGTARFLGVTGHGLSVARMHMRSLEQHDFDSVLLPWNYTMAQNPSYRGEFLQLREYCRERGIAMQTIKSVAKGPLGDQERPRDVWYDPLEDQDAIDTAIWWVMGHPELFLNSVGDIDLLPRVLSAAERFPGESPDEETMRRMVARTQQEPLFT